MDGHDEHIGDFQVGEATGTVCPTCGGMSEDERFCTLCGEVFGAAQIAQLTEQTGN